MSISHESLCHARRNPVQYNRYTHQVPSDRSLESRRADAMRPDTRSIYAQSGQKMLPLPLCRKR